MNLTAIYQNPLIVEKLSNEIKEITTRPWRVMEVCGGQTQSIMKYGLDQLLPKEIEFLHGPGCPICVTPTEVIDIALELATLSNVILCSFGDMMRVPGTDCDLLSVKALGANVKMVYSPLDAVKVAQENPDKEIIFFAVGFETTAPINALSVLEAKRLRLKNYSLLVSQVLVPPAISALLKNPRTQIDAFLAAGHVCTIMGEEEYFPLCEQYKIPIVISGFEPVDILEGVKMCIVQLESGQAKLENQYRRSVKRAGNQSAQKALFEVFEISNQEWRGLGTIDKSGLKMKDEYKLFDATKKFVIKIKKATKDCPCISGEILMGLKKPFECPAFGLECKPEKPLGAPMVSQEGACQAYYKYKKRDGKYGSNIVSNTL